MCERVPSRLPHTRSALSERSILGETTRAPKLPDGGAAEMEAVQLIPAADFHAGNVGGCAAGRCVRTQGQRGAAVPIKPVAAKLSSLRAEQRVVTHAS